MKRVLPVILALIAIPAFAQRGGGGHGGGGGTHGGGGGMRGGFSGGFSGGGMRGGAGGFRGGGGFTGFRSGFNRGFGFRGFSNFGYYPYLYTGIYGGCFYDPFCYDFWDSSDYENYPSSYGYPYGGYGGYGSSSPSVMIISNNPYGYAPPPPPEIVSAPPPIAQAPPQAAAPSKYEEPLYLIASHDGTIRAVLAYWIDGTTVHYVTMDHEQKQTPLSSIDRMLSERLNRERNVTFRLPG